MVAFVSCTTFNASQAAQDAKLAALTLTDTQQATLIASLQTNLAAAMASGNTKDAQQDTTIAALQLLVDNLSVGTGGGITVVTPAMVLTATQAMTPAQLAAMCSALNCGVSAAQLTAAILTVPGMNVAGNVLTNTGTGLQGQAPIQLSAAIAALPVAPTPIVPGTTVIAGADGYKYIFPLLGTGGGSTPAATATALGTVTLNQVNSLAAAQVPGALGALPNGGVAIPGTTFLAGTNGTALQLPAYPSPGQALVNCAGAIHGNGAQVPSCAEMNAAVAAAGINATNATRFGFTEAAARYRWDVGPFQYYVFNVLDVPGDSTVYTGFPNDAQGNSMTGSFVYSTIQPLNFTPANIGDVNSVGYVGYGGPASISVTNDTNLQQSYKIMICLSTVAASAP